VPNDKRPIVKEITELASKSEEVILATDLDREGEAIAWHLMEAAKIDPDLSKRVVFHEITKPAIEEAFAHPRGINMNLVDAQQGRRILDRLVGYSISPILWKKVRSRLSAGRVQSVALRLVVEREREIEDFVPEEYWSIEAEFSPEDSKDRFIAKLIRVDGKKIELNNEEAVNPLLKDMEIGKYMVDKVKIGQRKRKPQAPFTTSTLQQSASRRLRFTARKTMRIAQQLYEGIEIAGNGQTGLITYMRTDSTDVSKIAQQEARDFILKNHGEKYLPSKPAKYKTRVQRAQEAHEAIRPTSVIRTPKLIKENLTRDQFRLYQLIWQRFVASQMNPAVYDTISITVKGKTQDHHYLLRASGSSLRFPGFLKVYRDQKSKEDPKEKRELPLPKNLSNDQILILIRLIPEQHFTQPPPRYSEASLVKALEEYGIGRPSTYAPTISTLQRRGYVFREGRRLFPTETGVIVNDLVTEHFPDIVDLGFTANMEKELDQIASGEETWVNVIREFYQPFSKQVEIAKKVMPEVKTEPEKIGRQCPECGMDLIIRFGRHGKFIGCSGFPNCRYTEPFLQKIGVKCPKDSGELVQRKTRKGRTFYGCENYPECDFTSWKLPLPTPCPLCGGLVVAANRNGAVCQECDTRFNRDEFLSEEDSDSA
jgi:DNA topoisomerase-1